MALPDAPAASGHTRVNVPRRHVFSHWLTLSWTMTRRDWRAGELTTLLLAIVLAVAALTSVSFVADRMRQGLARDARQMFGADMRIRADEPLDQRFAQEARRRGLRVATTAVFPSMATSTAPPQLAAARPATHVEKAGTDTDMDAPDPLARLVAIKAVSADYPLRGALQITRRAATSGNRAALGQDVHGLPPPGAVWVDPPLLDALQLHIGDQLQLGSRNFRIDALITREWDRGVSFVNFAPRVIMREDDLASTGLIGRGSRVTYRLLVSSGNDVGAHGDAQIAAFEQWTNRLIGTAQLRGVGVESLSEGQPQVRETLDRADRFLRLVSMLTSLLAAVAIAMAAQRYARRHIDGCAVMRCLGASQRTLRGMFIFEFTLLGLVGGVLGGALGFLGHLILLRWLGSLLSVVLPSPSIWPLAQGVAAGLILLLGFALPPLFPLTRVPPGRVLRRDWGTVPLERWRYAFGVLLFAGLLVLAAGEWRLGGIVAGGFAVGVVVFGTVSWGVIQVLGRLTQRHPRAHRVSAGSPRADKATTAARRSRNAFGWRYALASLARRGGASAVQVSALTLALMCLLLLGMTRNDLIAGWRQSTPPDAPNRFIIDIQADQVTPVATYLSANGLTDVAPAPMIRGRLIQRNGVAIDPSHFTDSRVRRLVDREFNLSYSKRLPSDNRVTSGTWFGESKTPQISIEAGLAKDVGIHLGDTLRFDVAGQMIEAPVTSIRKLDWGSFRVNFFVLMPPSALADFPSTFITSFHATPSQQASLDALVRQYPNLTIIDTGAILAQLQTVLNQVINAVQFLFVFTLAAGLIVLYAALAGSRDERAKESALLRALGASHRQVRAVQSAELMVVGVLSGAMAAAGAQTLGWLLAHRVFDFPLSPNPWMPLVGIAAGVLCSVAGGWWSLRAVLNRPVLQTLRDA